MMCQACSEGRHEDCNLAVWCECECDPETATIDLALVPREGAGPDAREDEEEEA